MLIIAVVVVPIPVAADDGPRRMFDFGNTEVIFRGENCYDSQTF